MVRFVALVCDIAREVQPRDSVCSAYEPWVGDWPKRLADVGGVCDVAVGGEEDRAEAAGVCGVPDVGVCGVRGSEGC